MTIYLKINRAIPDQSVLGMLIEGILALRRSFLSISFCDCNREANVPAHYLARIASSSSPFIIWMEEVPLFVSPFMELDVQNSFISI